jgi:hypothetical protein
MWDCQYRTAYDYCSRRRAVCFPGGTGCVLKNRFVFPLRDQADPLIESRKSERREHAGKPEPRH